MASETVQLKTERLILRPFTEGDAEPFAAINADPEVMRYIGNGQPRDLERTREGIEKSVRDWDEQGWGTFAVEETATGELVGFAALAVPTFLPEILPAVEVGWRFKRDRWGRGYAPEAARAAIAFGFEEVGLDRVVSCIHSDNAASIRVAEKLGMTLERRTVVPGLEVPCSVYELKRA
ncbi:GNAT family N-acetyltransferase [Glycomyces buryatensis]|uniref:GNAT family N-acetyltransferase n=1 Tax=Glycomyces buryatensis TaxID=2570927 RepID=A0A4V4HSJ6_9ACTN|nr:GNAT family N-acetyltransferase [Glycomyces buryatensis]THV41956.1 GNAT family N-acetyltransferase [Glycomyces buryatensis]